MSEKPIHLALSERPWRRYEPPKALRTMFVTLACSDVWTGYRPRFTRVPHEVTCEMCSKTNAMRAAELAATQLPACSGDPQ